MKNGDRRPAPVARSATDIAPVANENAHRAVTAFVTAAPIVGLLLAGWQLWDRALRWTDVLIFVALYLPTGLGVTVGFHRHFTHRSFKTTPAVRVVLGVLGSAAVEGPLIAWVADHRKHHAFSDRPGDPHSPHLHGEPGLRGTVKGLIHAHVGWLFDHTERAARDRYAPDLQADPIGRFIDRTFLLWALAGLVLPFLLGVALGGSLFAGLTGLLWGGLVRMFVLHHVTYSINSLCHAFGRREYPTRDESRNVAWLALLSLGEAWHNNHHAFPTSARHGLRRTQLDPSSWVIATLERAGLAWDVVRITPQRQQRKGRALAEAGSQA